MAIIKKVYSDSEIESIKKEAELKGKQEILKTLNQYITDDFIRSSPSAFKFTEEFTPLWCKYVTIPESRTPEFKKKFKEMLH